MTARDRLADLVAAAARSRVAGVAVQGLARRLPARPRRFAVLTYHRVADPGADPRLHPGLVSATPAVFEAQMRALAATRPVIGLQELLALEGGASLPPGAVLLTFDDAYRDFATHAWPVLRALHLPVALFVPTGYPDQARAFWWDRLASAVLGARGTERLSMPIGDLRLATPGERHATLGRLQARLRALPHDELVRRLDELEARLGEGPHPSAVLGWAELRELDREGVVIAPHTVNHPLLTRIPPEAARREIGDSLADVEERIGRVPPVLAYPGGAWSPSLEAAARAAGVRLAFTTERGGNDLAPASWLRLHRINVGRRASPTLLQAELIAFVGGSRPARPRAHH